MTLRWSPAGWMGWRVPSSLRARLLTLAAIPLVPVFLLVLLLVVQQAVRKQADAEANAMRVARAMSVAVDAQLREVEASLTVLAASPALQDADFTAFRKQALTYQELTGLGTVVVLDVAGRQVVNTSWPEGPELPNRGAAAPAMSVITSGKSMARVIMAPETGQPLAVVSIPVRSQGQVRFALSTTVDFKRFDSLLREQRLPPSWVGIIMDPARIIVARTGDSARFVGTPPSKTIMEAVAASPEGSFDVVTLEGVAVRTLHASGGRGWAVAVGMPKAELRQELYASLLWLVGATVSALGLAAVSAWWYAERIGGAVEKLNRAARELGRGAAVTLPPLGIKEADQLAGAMAHASMELRSARDVLARNEARWSAVLEAAMDGIVAVNESQHIVIYNPAAETIFGWTREEALGQDLGMLIPPAQRGAHHAHVQQFGAVAETTRRMGRSAIVSGVRKSGEVFPVEATISHLNAGDGQLYTVIVRDVTQAVRGREELARLAAEASTVREQEKARIARELHDELAQSLAVIRMDLVRLGKTTGTANPGTEPALARMIALIDTSVAATRRIAADLRPLILDDMGLVAAIEWLAEEFTARTGVPCTVRPAGDLNLPEPYATGVFRIVQEALVNVAKHARATRVEVSAERGPSELLLSVVDDGAGFDTAGPRKPLSLGLAGLRERVHLLQGKLFVISAVGQGTRIEVRIPTPACATAVD